MNANRSHPFAASQAHRQSKPEKSPLAATLAPLLALWLDCMELSEIDVAHRRKRLSFGEIEVEAD